MKNPKIIYILVSAFCVIALIAGIYAQFFVENKKDNNIANENIIQQPTTEKTQEELKSQFIALLNNQNIFEDYDTSQIAKIDTTKDLVYNAITINEAKENYEVNINLPVVNIQGGIATGFNNNTQNLFANKASEILTSTSKEKTVYTVNYASYINGDILSVVIQSNLKEGSNPQRIMVQTYNYNLLTGEEVKLTDILSNEGIVQTECQAKINDTIKKAQEQAQILVESGYSVYNRNLNSDMYQINNVSTCFLGPYGSLYVIFAYGNQNYTSDMDIVLFE